MFLSFGSACLGLFCFGVIGNPCDPILDGLCLVERVLPNTLFKVSVQCVNFVLAQVASAVGQFR